MAIIFITQYWSKSDPVSQPSIISAIPLGLTSIALLLAQSASILLRTFADIASHKTAGPGAVLAALLRVQQPVAWGLLETLVCMILMILVSGAMRYSRDEEMPLLHAYIPIPALIFTTAALVVLFLIVFLQYSTVDLVMKIVDNHRYHELVSQYGAVGPAYFARTISSRLVAIFFVSQLEFVILIAAGVLNLFGRQKQNSNQRFATVLTVGTLIGCGVCALSEFGFIDYLFHVR
jgi:hypothetical protein